MADMMFALGQTKKKKTEETKVRQTKNESKDVTIMDTVEKSTIRSEQHTREQKWNSDGRDQIKANANVTILPIPSRKPSAVSNILGNKSGSQTDASRSRRTLTLTWQGHYSDEA
jgi:hypothetical protein